MLRYDLHGKVALVTGAALELLPRPLRKRVPATVAGEEQPTTA
jgi:hypothetical protein